jgi:hypothetical protein
MMSLRSAIYFHLFTICVYFQPFDSAQGREPVENPELVEVVERPRHRYQTSSVRFFEILHLLRHLFFHSKFDVGRSMFDVLFSQ